eukprot:1315339-Amorphochlora_amoeboformis.AAC.1
MREKRSKEIFRNCVLSSCLPSTRFGQGAFRMTLETVYRARMESLNIPEREIKERLGSFIQYGKPETVQFSHARRAALRQAERLGCTISKFYM